MPRTFVALTLIVGAIAQAPPMTNIPCAWKKTVDVPTRPELYVGTWYTIGVASKAWNRGHQCTQVVIDEQAASTDRAYIGSTTAINSTQTTPNVNATEAHASLITADLDTFNPPYKLKFPFPGVPANDFYIAATDGDGTPEGITAIVTYVCAPGMNNSQLFYLSRAPYLMAPVTARRLAAKAGAAIGNFADIQMDLVAQGQGWCDYKYPPTAALPSVKPFKSNIFRQVAGPLDTCTGPHESCCPAPQDDVNNCPASSRTADCDAKKSCCCG